MLDRSITTTSRNTLFDTAGELPAGLLLGLVLALSFGLNVYLLFLQPLGVVSLRRLLLAFGLGFLLSAFIWFFLRRHHLTLRQGWQRFVLHSGMWRAGLLLAAVLHLVFPAPPAHLFALPVDFEIEIQPLSVQPGEFRLVSLNNGMVDVSYEDIRPAGAAEIRPGSGIHFALAADEAVKFKWRGRGWQTLTLVFSSDQPLQMLIRYQNREERLRFEQAQPAERKISLPVSGWWYYVLIKVGVILLAAVSLAVLAALLRHSPLWEEE